MTSGAAASIFKPRVPALTGLRFFAALLVFFRHTGLPAPFGTFALSGTAGVTLFFTLSGFVLALNYFDDLAHPTPRKVWNFGIARVARIWPLYLVVLVYVLVRFQRDGLPVDGWRTHLFALQAWSSNIYEAYNFNGPNWSISVEFFLYACFPLIVVAVAWARSPRAIILLMGAVTAVLVAVTWWFVVSGRSLLSPIDGRSANRWLYRSPPMRLFDFTLGILAARLFVAARGRDLSRVGAWLALVGSVVFVTLMMQAWFLDTAFSNDVAYVLPGLFIIGGLAVAPASAGARALSTRPVVLLGEVSFAMYLVHAQVIHVMGPYSWGMTYGGRWTFLAVMLVVSVAVAWVLHRLVEIPGQRVLRRLSWRRTAAPTVAAVDALATSG